MLSNNAEIEIGIEANFKIHNHVQNQDQIF